MKFIGRYKSSKIVNKLTQKMLLSYSAIYIVILILLIILLVPRLYKESYEKAGNAANAIANEYYDLQDEMVSYLDFFAFSAATSSAIINYNEDPSDHNIFAVEQELQSFLSRYNKIKFVFIETSSGKVLTSYNFSGSSSISNLLNESGYIALKSHTYGFYYSGINNGNLQIPDKEGFTSCSFSKKYYYDGEPCILTLFFNTDSTLNNASKLSADILDDYVVIDKNNNIFYATNAESSLKAFNNAFAKEAEQESLLKNHGVYFQEYIPSSSYTIIAYSSLNTLLQDIIILILIVVLLYFIPPLLYWFILVPINIRYLSPLKRLSVIMNAYSVGDHVVSDIHTDDEIGELSLVFNEMIAKINFQVSEIVAKEKENAQTQYMLLVTQIEPHFIYNTMNIINILARKQNTQDIIKVNSALTRILQDRLSVKAGIFETVENEIAAIKEYLTIIDYRYANNIDVQFEIDETVKPYFIPKNLLQPLIENAFFHGLTDENGNIKGNISVMIYGLDNKVIIEVSDNGNGIDPESLKKLTRFNFDYSDEKRTHIGLENIYQRLCYIYKDNDRMHIQSQLGYGTTIILTLDLIKKDPNKSISEI